MDWAHGPTSKDGQRGASEGHQEPLRQGAPLRTDRRWRCCRRSAAGHDRRAHGAGAWRPRRHVVAAAHAALRTAGARRPLLVKDGSSELSGGDPIMIEALTTLLGGLGGTILLLMPGYVLGKVYSRGVRGPELSEQVFIATTAIGGVLTHALMLWWTILLVNDI